MFNKIPPQITLSIGTVAVLAMVSAFFIAPEHVQRDIREQGKPRAEHVVRALMNLEDPAVSPMLNKVSQWFGLCSAYAATSVAGFKAQVMSDPQLMEHYRNFDWEKAVVFENQDDAYSSVLYKKNGKMFWTRKPLLIRKGEKILTDGKIQVRTYCCNQITLAPPGPFLPPPDEPPPEDIQPPQAPAMPEFPPLDVPLIPPTLAFPPSRTKSFTPPVTAPRKERSPRSRIPVPIPGTFLLFVSGLGVLVLVRRLR